MLSARVERGVGPCGDSALTESCQSPASDDRSRIRSREAKDKSSRVKRSRPPSRERSYDSARFNELSVADP